MAFDPRPAGPKNLRELFHYLWHELQRLGGDDPDGPITPSPTPTPTPGTHKHNHDLLLNVTPDQHHSQVHDFLGADHTGIPFLLEEAPIDGQFYVRDGRLHRWEPGYSKQEADHTFLPVLGVDYKGFEGELICGGRFGP